MTRCWLPLRLALAGLFLVARLLHANADTRTDFVPDSPSDAPSPLNDFLGDVEVIDAGVGGAACTPAVNIPFPLALPSASTGCDATDTLNLNTSFYLSSVIVLPQPSDVELPAVLPAQEPSNVWLWVSVSMAVALVGGRVLGALWTKA